MPTSKLPAETERAQLWAIEIERIFAPKPRHRVLAMGQIHPPKLRGVGTPELERLLADLRGVEAANGEELAGFLRAASERDDLSIRDPDWRKEQRALAVGACAWLFVPRPEQQDFEHLFPRRNDGTSPPGSPRKIDSMGTRTAWAYAHYMMSLTGSEQPQYGSSKSGAIRRDQFRHALVRAVVRYIDDHELAAVESLGNAGRQPVGSAGAKGGSAAAKMAGPEEEPAATLAAHSVKVETTRNLAGAGPLDLSEPEPDHPKDGSMPVIARIVRHGIALGGSTLRMWWSRRSGRTALIGTLIAMVVAGSLLIALSITPLIDEGTPVTSEDPQGAIEKAKQEVTPEMTPLAGWRAGWGPERETFTIEQGGAPYPTFNSITDNPNFGDERNFVNVKRADSRQRGGWVDDIWANPGDVIVMRVYLENSGSDLALDVPAGSIQDARLSIGLSKPESGDFAVYGVLSGKNIQGVWDGATIHVDPGNEVTLNTSSAIIENNAHPGGGLALAAGAFSPEGTLLGYEQMDGLIKPGYQYAAYVTVELDVMRGTSGEGDSGLVESLGSSASDVEFLGGWGPERETFTSTEPATYAVLNSITDNPTHGDERNFVQIRPLGSSNESYAEMVRGDIGDEFVVYALVANDAADNLASLPATLQGLTATLSLKANGTDLPLSVILAAKNAPEVWDGASVITTKPASLRYVAGSTKFHTHAVNDGYSVPDDNFGAGSPISIGYDSSDGNLPVGYDKDGNYMGSGYLTFRIEIAAP